MKIVKDFHGVKIVKVMEPAVCLNLEDKQKRTFLAKDMLLEVTIFGRKFEEKCDLILN